MKLVRPWPIYNQILNFVCFNQPKEKNEKSDKNSNILLVSSPFISAKFERYS